jgi:cell division protein ZapA
MARSVELKVAGQSYRVVSSAAEDELQHLAVLVNRKLTEVAPAGRAPTPQALLLAAMALAHDLEEERGRRRALEGRTREFLRGLLTRIDAVLGASADAARAAHSD